MKQQDKLPMNEQTTQIISIQSRTEQNKNNADKPIELEAKFKQFISSYSSNHVKRLIEQKHYKAAFKLANKAVQLQHYPAYGDLARIYLISDPNNVIKRDLDQAFEIASEGALHNHANAQNILGICYRYFDDTEQNSLKALGWISKAAEQGYPDAQYNLGQCYQNGQGIQKNYQKAKEWYTRAADQGEPFSQNQLGEFYVNGWGVQKNLTKAVEWFTKAAENGHTWAQYNLGRQYKNGEGVDKDLQKAIEWLAKAAKQGHTSALNELKQLLPNSTIKQPQIDHKKLSHEHGQNCKH